VQRHQGMPSEAKQKRDTQNNGHDSGQQGPENRVPGRDRFAEMINQMIQTNQA